MRLPWFGSPTIRSLKKWSFIHNKNKTKSQVTVTGSFYCPSGKSLLNAAKADLGVVRLPKIYCLKEIENDELVSVIKGWSPESVPIYLLYYNHKLQTKKLTLLINYITASFRNIKGAN